MADITTTAGGSWLGARYHGGGFFRLTVFQVGGVNLEEDKILVDGQDASGRNLALELYFIEVRGTFVGGQIVKAAELDQRTGFILERDDLSGQALAVDPALVAPEPATWGCCLLALVALGFVSKCRRARI
jgi:hypothetical protein